MDQGVSGWLNIYKPKNFSSAHIVAAVKRNFKGRKVGHAGTLDLEAQGVLPIAIGEATKLISILMNARKIYRFSVKFGTKTDTADSAGKIIAVHDHRPTLEECSSICKEFLGSITQVPPIYSALKLDGKRAYELARAGAEFELTARQVTIYSLICEKYDADTAIATYVCECSKGTYIRTLAEDISLRLQTLGFVVQLERLQVGKFQAIDALGAENIDDNIGHKPNYLSFIDRTKDTILDKNGLMSKCLEIEYVLDDIPVLSATASQVQQIRYGQLCEFVLTDNLPNDDGSVWIKNIDGRLLAIGKMQGKIFKSSRVFNI